MSALDKRRYADYIVGTSEAHETVRIFAFDNRRTGYKVVFSPESPLIILKTKSPPTPQHPCLQWNAFSTLIHEVEPNTTNGSIYLVDMACLQGHEFQTAVRNSTTGSSSCCSMTLEGPNTSIGPVMKKLRNALGRLNPHNATLIAAGSSCFLALKYVLVGEKKLGHADRLVRCLVLVHPGPAPTSEMEKLVMVAAGGSGAGGMVGGSHHFSASYPKPEIRVLVQTREEERQWSRWLDRVHEKSGLFSSSHVYYSSEEEKEKGSVVGEDPITSTSFTSSSALPVQVSSASLFHSIAYVCGITNVVEEVEPHIRSSSLSSGGVARRAYGNCAVDTIHRWRTPRVYRLDVFLSRQTKTVVQRPVLSPLDTLGYDTPHPLHEGEAEEEEDAQEHGWDEEEEEEEEDREEAEMPPFPATFVTSEVEGGGDGASNGKAASASTRMPCTAEGVTHEGKNSPSSPPPPLSPPSCPLAHPLHQHHHHDGCQPYPHPHPHDHEKEEEVEGEEEMEEEEEGENCFGLANWLHVKAPARITLEGRLYHMAKGILHTTEGVIHVKGMKTLALKDPAFASFIKEEEQEEEKDRERRKNNTAVTSPPSSSSSIRNNNNKSNNSLCTGLGTRQHAGASTGNHTRALDPSESKTTCTTSVKEGRGSSHSHSCTSSSKLAPFLLTQPSRSHGRGGRRTTPGGGVAIQVDTVLERDAQGRTHLVAHSNLHKLSAKLEKASFTIPEPQQPAVPYEVSAVRYRVAALVVRGRKCALQRGEGEEEKEEEECCVGGCPVAPPPRPMAGPIESIETHSTTNTTTIRKVIQVNNAAPPPPLLSLSSSSGDGGNAAAGIAAPLDATTALLPLGGSVFSLPSALVTDSHMNLIETALNVACEAFDCSPDNFYIPHYIPPSVMYIQKTEEIKQEHPQKDEREEEREAAGTSGVSHPPSTTTITTTCTYTEVCYVYLFVTSAGPPGGPSSDRVDDPFSDDNSFEWMSFLQAYRSLATAGARAVLVELQQRLHHAYKMGLYQPCMGCGIWGEGVGSEPMPLLKDKE